VKPPADAENNVRHEFDSSVCWEASDYGQERARSGVRCDGDVDESVAAAVLGERFGLLVRPAVTGCAGGVGVVDAPFQGQQSTTGCENASGLSEASVDIVPMVEQGRHQSLWHLLLAP
jgi:hypothetical protein